MKRPQIAAYALLPLMWLLPLSGAGDRALESRTDAAGVCNPHEYVECIASGGDEERCRRMFYDC